MVIYLIHASLSPSPSLLLIFLRSWLCHIDDDLYMNLPNLIKLLSLYDPKTEPIYFGGAWQAWHLPESVCKAKATIHDAIHCSMHATVAFNKAASCICYL